MTATEMKASATQDPVWRYHLLRAATGKFERGPTSLAPAELAEAESLARRSLLIESIVLGSDEARDMPLAEDEVDAAVANIRARYDDPDTYRADLQRNDLDEVGLRRAVDRELRVTAVLDRVSARAAAVYDIDVQLYYHLHRDELSQPETRTVRQILITVNDAYPENRREAARARIEAVATRVARKPQRFEEQAMKHSECPSAMNGGLLGRLPRGQLFPELDAALFALAEGAVSEVVESEIGFHVLYCEAIRPQGPPPFDEAEPVIRERLAARQRRICQRGWLGEQARRQKAAAELSAEAAAHG